MPTLLVSDAFEDRIDRLEDNSPRIKIVARLRSVSAGNFGDAKAGAKLRYETVWKVMTSLGVRLTVAPSRWSRS